MFSLVIVTSSLQGQGPKLYSTFLIFFVLKGTTISFLFAIFAAGYVLCSSFYQLSTHASPMLYLVL